MPFGPCVRSVFFFLVTSHIHPSSDPCHVTGISFTFGLLNVLGLGCINIGKTFHHEIELLVHLRILAAQGRMNSVPSSIVALWNLESFSIKDTIWYMARMRHLHVNNGVAFN